MKGGVEMSEISVALQLFSVKNAMREDIEGTLKKISEIGYKFIEVPIKNEGEKGEFLPDIPAATLKEYLEKYNLQVIGSHVGYERELNLDQVADYNLALECNVVVIPAHFYSTKQDAYNFADWLNQAGEKLKERHMKLFYHNHYHEFQELDGEVVLEILLEHTDPELVSFEFDTFWAMRAGIDLIKYLDRLGDRCGLIHQKDLNEKADPVNLLKHVSGELDAEAVFSPVNPADFVEIGSGIIDIKSIIKKAKEMKNVSYIIVEQDRTVKGELQSVEESFIQLNQLMQMVNDTNFAG